MSDDLKTMVASASEAINRFKQNPAENGKDALEAVGRANAALATEIALTGRNRADYHAKLQNAGRGVVEILKTTKPNADEFALETPADWEKVPTTGERKLYVGIDDKQRLRIVAFDAEKHRTELFQDEGGAADRLLRFVDATGDAHVVEPRTDYDPSESVKKLRAKLLETGPPPDPTQAEKELKELVIAVASIPMQRTALAKRASSPVLDHFVGVAQRFQRLEESAGVETRELLNEIQRSRVGWMAIGMFGLGAISAAVGADGTRDYCTTLACWLGFGSFILATLWLLAFYSVHRSSAPLPQTHEDGLRLQYLIFGGLSFLVLGVLAAGILTNRLVEPLRTVPGARGLITFLIAIGTIAIAVILALASVVMKADNEGMLKERLSKGKEILTVLVGVLGTIVGFYFASNPDGSGPVRITIQPRNPPWRVTVGTAATFTASAAGGELPYNAIPMLTFGDGGTHEGCTLSGKVSRQGVIELTLKVDASARPESLPLVIGCRDSGERIGAIPINIEVVVKDKP